MVLRKSGRVGSRRFRKRRDSVPKGIGSFFVYKLSIVIVKTRFSRFFVGTIFYTREVLLTSHYEKRLFDHASQPRVAGSDIRLLSYLWS